MPSRSEIDTASLLLQGISDSDLGMCLCDPSDQVQFVNDKFRRAFFPTAPGSGSFDFVDAIAVEITAGTGIRLETIPLEDFVPRVRERRRHGPARFEFHVDLSDGTWWRVFDHRLDNGWILVVAVDITLMKQEELESSISITSSRSMTDMVTRWGTVFSGIFPMR